MTKNFNIVITACAVLFTAFGLHATLRAQAQAAADGVYTEAQAMRGATVYAEQCASCHGEDMMGVPDLFPALIGDTFVANWQGKSVGELFEKISLTMPALDPGSLMPAQVADLVAHALSASEYPAGTAELAPDVEALKGITINAPDRAQAQTAADGVYTEAQAMRGATVYAEQCASCHGEDMTGVPDLFPALIGDTFAANWQGKSVGELFEKVSLTMPALDPGSLMPAQVADLVAHALSASEYPAGTAELAPDVEALKGITINAPE